MKHIPAFIFLFFRVLRVFRGLNNYKTMILRHPFRSLTPSAQKKALIFLSLSTIVLMRALTMLDAPLKTERAPFGIVSFEFAGTLSQAQEMLESWGQTGQLSAALSLGLDSLFLVLYSVCIALGCALVASNLTDYRILSGIGVLLSWAQFGAGGLDALENVALIRILLGSEQPVWPVLALVVRTAEVCDCSGRAGVYRDWNHSSHKKEA